MKKTIILLAAVGMIFTSGEAKTKKPKKTVEPAPVAVFANDVDSMSYALGLNVGADFAKNIKTIPGGKSNIDLLIKGFTTAMKGDSALMTADFANKYFQNFMTTAQAKESVSKKADGEAFLAENKTKEGVKITESGLQYQVVLPAEGPKPQLTDSVEVHYQGFLLNGTKFDSSIDRGEPITFPLNQVISGWSEGIQLMSVGSKYKFFIPYTLGYGDKGAGAIIPPFATLIFEVELLKIKPIKEIVPASVVKTSDANKGTKSAKGTKRAK